MEGQQVQVERQLPFGILFFFSLHTLNPAKRCFSPYRQTISARDSREVNNFFQFASITRPEDRSENDDMNVNDLQAEDLKQVSVLKPSLVYPKQ